MRNVIKYIIISVLSLSLLFVVTACEDPENEDEKKYSVVGTWLMSSVVMKDTPIGDLTLTASGFLAQSGTGAQTSTLILNEDGSAAVTTTYEAAPDSTEPGSWTQDGDMLTINGAGIDDTVPFSVDEETLIITLTMPVDFYSNGMPEDIQIDMTYEKQ